MRVLDSTFLVDLIRGVPESLKILRKNEVLLTTQINMYEVIKGLYLKKVSSRKFMEINALFENIKVLLLDDKAVLKSAEIYAELVRKGIEISNTDCMIAGIALSSGVSRIVTRNGKHFERIKGINVIAY